MSDATVRALWRAFVQQPTPENAHRWACMEARLRGDLPDPPAIDSALSDHHEMFGRLSPNSSSYFANALARTRGEAERMPPYGPTRGTLLVRDLADAKGVGVGDRSLIAAATGLELLGIFREPWADYLTRSRRVLPGIALEIAGRAAAWSASKAERAAWVAS